MPDDEVNGAVPRGELLESLAELVVAVAGLGEEEFRGGGLEVVGEEDGIVSVACGVDADADADEGGWSWAQGVERRGSVVVA